MKSRRLYMALIDKVNPPRQPRPDDLTLKEYEFLFEIIKSSNFQGQDLELIYNLTIKLQEQYLYLKNR